MFSKVEFENIKTKYKNYSSWAIWSFDNEKDVSIIEKNIELLHSNYVFIGLNVSKIVSDWENFHIGKHDRKIKFAFNSIPEIRGSYMTDLIKEADSKSENILLKVEKGEINIEKCVQEFIEELSLLKISSKSKFIIFGNITQELYERYFEKYFPENKAFYLKHYSGRGTDKEWVENVWNKFNINYLNFEKEKSIYSKT